MDLRDAVGLVGIGLVVAGVTMWSLAAALVLSGAAVLGVYVLLELRGGPQPLEVREPTDQGEARR